MFFLYVMKQHTIQTCKTGDEQYSETSPNGEYSLAEWSNRLPRRHVSLVLARVQFLVTEKFVFVG